MKDVFLYGYEGQEILSSEPEEVVLDLMQDDQLPKFPIKVHVFKRMDASNHIKNMSRAVLETVIESTDDEYADPNGQYTNPTENMKKAAIEFLDVMAKEYTSWMCEPTNEILEFNEEQSKKIANY